MNRIALAFRSFFSILFTGKLPEDVAQALGFTQSKPQPAAPKPTAQARPQDGALQILGILQRDSRLIDFLMEDISAYSDEQVGAAVRSLHDQSRESLNRYLHLAPVIDGVEGSFTKLETTDPSSIKLLGNVPVSGKAPAACCGTRAGAPKRSIFRRSRPDTSASIIAPAEVEIE